MIVYDLHCAAGHAFEGWFGSSADYDRQRADMLLSCPLCNSSDVSKAPMAPALASGGRRESARVPAEPSVPVANVAMPPKLQEAFRQLAQAQAKALSQSRWVGTQFADEVRAQHYGEKDEAPVHGKASADEAQALVDEGIMIAPLLIPVVDPDELN